MKFATAWKSMVMGLALLLASSAFAATTGTMEISNPLMVNGTTLKAGDYKVQWEGAGPNVEVSILRGKNVVAKVQAHVVDLPAPVSDNAAVTHQNGSGPNSLTALRFRGKRVELDFSEATEAMQMDGSSK